MCVILSFNTNSDKRNDGSHGAKSLHEPLKLTNAAPSQTTLCSSAMSSRQMISRLSLPWRSHGNYSPGQVVLQKEQF